MWDIIGVDAYRAIVDKRDQRAFLDKPVPVDALQRLLQAGRIAAPLTELVHWQTW